MKSVQPPVPSFQKHHLREVEDFARRHYSDPDVKLADVAAFLGVNERTLRRSLRACGRSWREVLKDRRMERAHHLLATESYRIDDVARLSGYRSAPAFAKVFSERFEASPSEFRRGKGGVARAGGPTGAFRRPAQRARAELRGELLPDGRTRAWSAGDAAVEHCRTEEAGERIADRRLLEHGHPGGGVSIEELAHEIASPTRLRDDPDHWRERRRVFDEWVERNNRPPAEGQLEEDW
jgi:AraC-like DNA-binding protein